MLIGLQKGKLGGWFKSPFTDIEDLLTSVVFGSLKYVPVAEGLLPFLGSARTSDGVTLSESLRGATQVEYQFWPRWDASSGSDDMGAGSEPELVLRLFREGETFAWILVEAKLWSGKSSTATQSGPVADQLGRYWVQLRARVPTNEVPMAVVYVTRGVVLPEQEFEETQRELASKNEPAAPLYWLSWRHFESALRRSKHPLVCDVRDMLQDAWGLSMPETAWSWPDGVPNASVPAWQFDPDWSWPARTVSMNAWAFQSPTDC